MNKIFFFYIFLKFIINLDQAKFHRMTSFSTLEEENLEVKKIFQKIDGEFLIS